MISSDKGFCRENLKFKNANARFYCKLSDVKLNYSNPHHCPKLFFHKNRILLKEREV